jgi:hypothetical protein
MEKKLSWSRPMIRSRLGAVLIKRTKFQTDPLPGIDKHLADKARKFADRTEEEFETFLAKAVQKVSDVVEGQSPFVCSSCSPENSDR